MHATAYVHVKQNVTLESYLLYGFATLFAARQHASPTLIMRDTKTIHSLGDRSYVHTFEFGLMTYGSAKLATCACQQDQRYGTVNPARKCMCVELCLFEPDGCG